MTKKYQKKTDLVEDELLGNVESEPSIDELLDKELPKSKPSTTPTTRPMSVPRTSKGTMVSFIRSSDNKRISAPASLYFVVKGEGGKLHYKEVSQCTILNPDWKEGDEINGITLPSDYIPGNPIN